MKEYHESNVIEKRLPFLKTVNHSVSQQLTILEINGRQMTNQIKDFPKNATA